MCCDWENKIEQIWKISRSLKERVSLNRLDALEALFHGRGVYVLSFEKNRTLIIKKRLKQFPLKHSAQTAPEIIKYNNYRSFSRACVCVLFKYLSVGFLCGVGSGSPPHELFTRPMDSLIPGLVFFVLFPGVCSELNTLTHIQSLAIVHRNDQLLLLYMCLYCSWSTVLF